MSIEERTKAANQRAEKAMHEARVKQRAKQKGTERTNNRRNYIVGELVCKYFPQLNDIEPGTNEENAERFALLDCFLKTLSFHPEIIHDILDEAQYMLDEEDNV